MDVADFLAEKLNAAFDALFAVPFLAPFKHSIEEPFLKLTSSPVILLPLTLITTLFSLSFLLRALTGGKVKHRLFFGPDLRI